MVSAVHDRRRRAPSGEVARAQRVGGSNPLAQLLLTATIRVEEVQTPSRSWCRPKNGRGRSASSSTIASCLTCRSATERGCRLRRAPSPTDRRPRRRHWLRFGKPHDDGLPLQSCGARVAEPVANEWTPAATSWRHHLEWSSTAPRSCGPASNRINQTSCSRSRARRLRRSFQGQTISFRRAGRADDAFPRDEPGIGARAALTISDRRVRDAGEGGEPPRAARTSASEAKGRCESMADRSSGCRCSRDQASQIHLRDDGRGHPKRCQCLPRLARALPGLRAALARSSRAKTQACVSSTYLRATAGLRARRRSTTVPRGAKPPRREGRSLVEAEQLFRPWSALVCFATPARGRWRSARQRATISSC